MPQSLTNLQNHHLSGILGFATKEELKKALIDSEADLRRGDMTLMVNDFRFKGYVNDFMVTPRNPITQEVIQQQKKDENKHLEGAAAAAVEKKFLPHPPAQPSQVSQPPAQSQSAELRVRKAEADRDIAAFKRDRIEEMIKNEKIKKEAFESMRLYKPFGKPGGGAPIYADYHHRQKFTEYNLDDSSGSEETSDMGFPRYNYEPTVTKKPEPFQIKQPGNSAIDRAMEDTQARIDRLQRELDAMNTIPYIDPVGGKFSRPDPPIASKPFEFYDPWGKGQGNPRRKADGKLEGYPHIQQKGIVPSVSQSLPSSIMEMQPPISNQYYQPYSAPVKHIEQAPLGNIILPEKTAGTGLNFESKYGGGGEPTKTGSGHQRTRFPITMKADIYGNSNLTELDGYNPFKGRAPENPNYFPFGKPGAGAPITDARGKPQVQRHKVDFNLEGESSADQGRRRRRAEEYLHELKKEMEEQRRTREEANVEVRAPIGELATLIRQGKVGKPKRDPVTGNMLDHHHVFSDVTKVKQGLPESKKYAGIVGQDDPAASAVTAKAYHNDLSKIAEERYQMRQLEKMRELYEDKQHGDTWNEFWGRPGAGAPNSKDPSISFKRPKFEELLHHPENRSGLMLVKNTPHGITDVGVQNHYHRNTVGSNHANMFELPVHRQPGYIKGADYKLVSPFATLLPN